MSDFEIFDMPMEFGLELVAIVSPLFTNTERELFNAVINEVDHSTAGYAKHSREERAYLRVFLVDLKGPNSCRIIDRGELEAAYFSPRFPLNVRNLTSTWI